MRNSEEENYLIGVRRHLHQNPELSEQEYKTSAFVKNELKDLKNIQVQSISKTGILVTQKADKPGRTLLIRADMDALPIQEVNDFDYRSSSDGVSHKCGHDGHTTILLGLIRRFQKEPFDSGIVHFLFQPAEENGKGAAGVMQEEEKIIPKPDRVYALHNLPAYSLHEVVCREASFTAAANSIILELHGKTSHAAEPELGLNPALALSQIIAAYQKLIHANPADDEFQLLTPVYANLGEKAYGVSAGYAELHYTLRCWSNDRMKALEEQCIAIAEKFAKESGLELKFRFTEKFFSNQNDRKAFEHIRSAAAGLGLKFTERAYPFKWGEDFGLYTEKFPGAMFGIGSGEDCPALHNPDYDFPDEIIQTGIDMFERIIREEMGQ